MSFASASSVTCFLINLRVLDLFKGERMIMMIIIIILSLIFRVFTIIYLKHSCF